MLSSGAGWPPCCSGNDRALLVVADRRAWVGGRKRMREVVVGGHWK